MSSPRHSCPHCDKTFSRPYHLQAHLDSIAGRKPFACDLCGTRFIRQHDLKKHRSEQHVGYSKHPCETCGRLFDRKATLQRHRKGMSCKVMITSNWNNSLNASLPLRPSPILSQAFMSSNSGCADVEMMDVEEVLFSEEAMDLVADGTLVHVDDDPLRPNSQQLTLSNRKRRFPQDPEPESWSRVLDVYRPSHRSTINIDLVAWYACTTIWFDLYKAVTRPEPARTSLLCSEYSKTLVMAQESLALQRPWSHYSCLFVLLCIDVIFDGNNAKSEAFDKFTDRWDPYTAGTDDPLRVGYLDVEANLPTPEEVSSAFPVDLFDEDFEERLDHNFEAQTSRGAVSLTTMHQELIRFASDCLTYHSLTYLHRTNFIAYPGFPEIANEWHNAMDKDGVAYLRFSPLNRQLRHSRDEFWHKFV